MNDKPRKPHRDGKPQGKGGERPHGFGKPAQSRGFGKRKFEAGSEGERQAKPKWAGRPRAGEGSDGQRAGERKDYAKPQRARASGDERGETRSRKPYRAEGGDRRAEGGDKRPERRFADRPGKDGERRGKPDDRPRRPFTDRSGDERGESRSRKPYRAEGDDRRAEGGDKRPERRFADRPGKDGERRGKPDDRPKRSFSDRPGERRSGRPPRQTADAAAAQSERIAKRLARAGVSSRREAEALIEAGRVSVNGEVLDTPARNVGPGDVILIDGTPIPAIERTRLFLFHKPAGVVTTNRDPQGRKTVFDILPADLPRLMTVGRLDINTEGLLLLTNDGGLARVLELPATGWLRRYRVRVHGQVDEARLASLREGVAVDGVFYGAVEATLDREQGSNAWLTIGLREGKNREVKNILGSLGLDVTRLIRVSYGPFQLGELAEGAVQELKGRTLRDQLGDTLIEEAGANFDAPVVKPFSNKPVAGAAGRQASRPDVPARQTRHGEPGEGGLIKNRKRLRENRRDDALGRLQTTKPKWGERPERNERAEGPARTRNANVWMAPGARPRGKPKDERDQDGAKGGRGGGKPGGEAPKRPGRGPGHADRRR